MASSKKLIERLATLAAFITFLLLFLAQELDAEAATPIQNQASYPAVIRLKIADSILTTELARTPSQSQRGLMYRTTLAPNAGMLFVMQRIGPASFWMKNTYIPLSLVFLDRKGVVLEFEDKMPLDLTITHTQSQNVAFVIEANIHWFVLHHLKVGDTIVPLNYTWVNIVSAESKRRCGVNCDYVKDIEYNMGSVCVASLGFKPESTSPFYQRKETCTFAILVILCDLSDVLCLHRL